MYAILQRSEGPPRPSTNAPDPAVPLMRAIQQENESVVWKEFVAARKRGDIPALVQFIYSSEKAKELVQRKYEWASPVSVGGHAVSALADLCQDRGTRAGRAVEVAEALTNDIHQLVQYVESPQLELQDPSIVLLFSVMEKLSSEIKTRLVNIGLFEGLMQIMKSGFKLKREMAADTCRALYDGSDLRKDKFVELGGVTTLVHVMNMDGDDPNFLHNALLRLYVLIQVRST